MYTIIQAHHHITMQARKHTVNLISLLLAHMNSTKSEQIYFTIKQL